MNLKHIKKVQRILTKWNPLGEQAKLVSDLNDYETEATDIIYHINSELDYKKKGDPRKRIQLIMQQVIEEAFDVRLTDEECNKPAEEIFNSLK